MNTTTRGTAPATAPDGPAEAAALTRPLQDPDDAAPVRRSRLGDALRSATYPVLSIVILALGLVGLEIAVRREVISELVLPAPSSVWQALRDGLAVPDGIFWTHISSTVGATIPAFLIAAAVAIALASAMSVLPWFEGIIMPYIIALQAMPKIALAPVIVIWFGFGTTSKLVIAALTAFFPIIVNSLHGFRLRNRDEYELMVSIGASRYQIYRYIRLPNAVPFIFAGLHLGIIYALLGVIVAEFVSGQSGLAFYMLSQRAIFNVPGVFAIIVILIVIGMVLHGGMKFAESKLVFWSKESSRDAV